MLYTCCKYLLKCPILFTIHRPVVSFDAELVAKWVTENDILMMNIT